MNVQGILRKQIVNYLLENPIDRGTPGCYKTVGDKFKVDSEYVRRVYRTLRDNGQVESDEIVSTSNNSEKREFKQDFKSGLGAVEVVTHKRVKTIADLVEVCEIDLTEWDIVSAEVTKWEVGRKDKTVVWKITDGQVVKGDVQDNGKIFVEPLFRVKAKLAKRRVDTDLVKQKEAVMAELKAYRPNTSSEVILSKYRELVQTFEDSKKDCILEINVPDLHVGKLSWAEETGENYDFKIAVKRYKEAVAALISRTPIDKIEKILLVVGHDFLNSDGKSNLTTAGTPQHNDVRFYKMIKVGKALLIETIDELSLLAKVDIMVVPGNHDTNSMLMMGDVLEAWYHNSDQVQVFNSPAPRKYYQYGHTGLVVTHGHSERIADLGMLFATENKKLWADTQFHRVHLGHFHHSKQIRYKDVEEQIGCIVKIINSLSSNDAWHTEKGYLSLKGAEAFLYHKKQGILANYYYYV